MVLSGCAERGLVAAPEHRQGASTWAAVWVAGLLAAALAGLALTLPAWRTRSGSRFATGVLTLQTGGVAVVGTLLVGLAVRSWQLIERPLDSPPAHALVRLSRVDGDTALFSLLTLTIVVLGVLLVVLLGVATRFAASDEPVERWVACAILGLEIGGAVTLGVLMAFGHRGWPFLGGVVALPLLVAAFATCWPTNVSGRPRTHAVHRSPQTPGPATIRP